MTKGERKKQSKYLKHGDISTIAELSGMHKTNVSKWINGHLQDSSCEVYFISLVDKRKAELENKMTTI